MANQPIGGLKTLAQTQDVENATNKVLVDVWSEVEGMVPKLWQRGVDVDVRMDEPTSSNSSMMPIPQCIDHGADPNARAKFLEDSVDWEGQVDVNQLKNMAENGDFDAMPAHFGPKEHIQGVG